MRKFKPYLKPEKVEKKAPIGRWINGCFIQTIKSTIPNKTKSSKITKKFKTSNGEKVSQNQIESRRSKAYERNTKPSEVMCQCCGKRLAQHRDHSISQARCKQLHKTELIWDPKNWSLSCAKSHHEWESYKSGDFKKHKNYSIRMNFVKLHDPEGYRKRINLADLNCDVVFKQK